MAGQNVRFTDVLVTQKPVGRFGVCPVLADQANALAGSPGQLAQHYFEAPRQPGVFKCVVRYLVIDPAVMPSLMAVRLRGYLRFSHVSLRCLTCKASMKRPVCQGRKSMSQYPHRIK